VLDQKTTGDRLVAVAVTFLAVVIGEETGVETGVETGGVTVTVEVAMGAVAMLVSEMTEVETVGEVVGEEIVAQRQAALMCEQIVGGMCLGTRAETTLERYHVMTAHVQIHPVAMMLNEAWRLCDNLHQSRHIPTTAASRQRSHQRLLHAPMTSLNLSKNLPSRLWVP
jgi:hypothetical protein